MASHPFVIGELACGHLRNRQELLRLFAALPSVTVATHEESLLFIETHDLSGKGLGYIDVHLLASTMLTEAAQLWTRDRQLQAAAERLRIA